jgi:hypothetical protein
MDEFGVIRETTEDVLLRTVDHEVELMLAAPRTHQPSTTGPSTAGVLHCIECRRPWLDSDERWRLKVTDDSPPETVPYCARCASREFGPAVSRKRV